MPAGLIVYNQSGALQIDSQYRNMTLVATGNIALDGQDGATCYAEVPRSNGNSVIAWRSFFPVARANVPSGNFRLSAQLPNRGAVIRYYVFDWPQLVTSGSGGLQVFSPGGILLFDSSMRWFKVSGLVNTGGPTDTGENNSFPARTYATMQASPAGYISFNQLGGADAQGNATFAVNSAATGTYATSNGMGWGPVKYYDNAQIKANVVPPPQGGGTGTGNALLLDVTNY